MSNPPPVDRFQLLLLQRAASNGEREVFAEALGKGACPFMRAPIHSRGTCALLHAVSAASSPNSVFPVLVEKFGSEPLLARAYLDYVANSISPRFAAEEMVPVLTTALVSAPSLAQCMLADQAVKARFSAPPALLTLWNNTLHAMFSAGRSPPSVQGRIIETLLNFTPAAHMFEVGGATTGMLRNGLSMLTLPALKSCLESWRQQLRERPSALVMEELSRLVLKGAERMPPETSEIYFREIRKEWPQLSPFLLASAAALGGEAVIQGNWPTFMLALQAQDISSFGSDATPFQPTLRDHLGAARHEYKADAPLSVMEQRFGPALDFDDHELRLVASTWHDPEGFISWIGKHPQVRVGNPTVFVESLSKDALESLEEAGLATLQERYLGGLIPGSSNQRARM